jgi:hypothetical protein
LALTLCGGGVTLSRYAVAWEIPNPAPWQRRSGRSRNQASAKAACFQQVGMPAPIRVTAFDTAIFQTR